MKKIIIIGGGASGLCCAIHAKTEENDVIVLEKNKECGKKILITGNGKCNFYNENQDIEHYHSSNNELLDEFINEERIKKILPFFKNIGIIPDIKDGYYYPMSNQAISVRNSLVKECENLGVKIIYNCNVIDVEKDNNKFIISTDNGIFESDALVVATGSKAYPKTGSTGDGYDFAKKFGHSIIKPLPGLVQLVSKENLKDISGVRTKAKLSLIENNKMINSFIGEIQITDYGISGIVSMQLSSYVSRGLDFNKKEEIIINFLPTINDAKLFITSLNETVKNRTISELLDGLLNYKLVNFLLKKSHLKGDEYYNNLSEESRDILIDNLTSYKINIEDTKEFDNSQICIGGVPLTELNKTFESKIISSLFFTGEVVDINGDCGGYNLSIAWISGIIAGIYLKNKCL